MKSLSTLLTDADIKRGVDIPKRENMPFDFIPFVPAVSQWQDIVGRFVTEYNKSTTSKFFYSEKRMAMKLSPILKREGIEYLEYFYEECKRKDNFGKWFNYALNPRNIK